MDGPNKVAELQPKPSVCVATLCVDDATASALQEALNRKNGRLAGETQDYARAETDALLMQEVQAAELPVWVVGFDRKRTAAVAAAHALHQRIKGHGCLIAISRETEPSLILEAVHAGCCEYLTVPVSAAQFSEAFDRLRARCMNRALQATKPSGRVIGLLGARGGAGVTALSVHLASFLSGYYHKKTLILDEHRRMGHVALYLGVDGTRYHFYELVRNLDRLDAALLDAFVVHQSCWLDLLPSPDLIDDSANVSLDSIQQAIRFIGQQYEYVVIDCPRGVHNLSLATIDCCDEVYLIATPDVPALRDLSRAVDHLLQNNVPPGKLHVVINRYSSAGALTLKQIEKGIRQPIAITIPNASADLIDAMNTGNPVLPGRKSEFAVQMKKWAQTLVGEEEGAPESKPKLGFWKRAEAALAGART